MPRYFIEVSYKGTNYSGFQIQENANSIQAAVQKALKIFYKKDVDLTGSSRTDAGVHALQNYFHFDLDEEIRNDVCYNLNALLPKDIAIKKILIVKDNAHCRFDAVSREYKYFIYQNKNPFLQDSAFYFPYKLDIEKLNAATKQIICCEDFTSFSKKNTQVNNFICKIARSEWYIKDDIIIYHVIANRFLRGMVKGLVGTMLRIGTGKISAVEFSTILMGRDQTKVDFSPPSHGLFLCEVKYKQDIFL